MVVAFDFFTNKLGRPMSHVLSHLKRGRQQNTQRDDDDSTEIELPNVGKYVP